MVYNPESILDSTKKAIGLAPDYDPFDPELIMYINDAFATLDQLGIGPEGGFSIEDSDAVWESFIGTDKRLNGVKVYVAFKVKLAFDPPPNSFTQEALRKQIAEQEWRLNLLRETYGRPGTVTVITSE